ncbi:uncharacterized protein CELE_C47F8.7 [Caenorhabditis elegans]|uniref:Uncharacterized protein n=1 Tax=Caenorhabditis elegans TaxID=6239 RepID=O62110_CAEEL|nr:Uncharacterized protein CELE_C47F8.7 [Caenorhabditis elegans]CAA15834.1 Uncharacterized protein CELE_C47F8.7 [Caenorhabditis elegans]|eukprot:NP_493117.1 Uncharacterized protein CELE_C47F8.7 [Caenorhabditis elegans]
MLPPATLFLLISIAVWHVQCQPRCPGFVNKTADDYLKCKASNKVILAVSNKSDAPIYETFTIKSYYESETPFSDDDMNNLPEKVATSAVTSVLPEHTSEKNITRLVKQALREGYGEFIEIAEIPKHSRRTVFQLVVICKTIRFHFSEIFLNDEML